MWVTILGLLGNWRVILGVIIAVIVGVLTFKFHDLETTIADSKAKVAKEQANNIILQNNFNVATAANAANQKILQQLEADRKAQAASVDQLGKGLMAQNQAITELKGKLNGLQAKPQPLSPYIAEAVTGIQQLRDKENPPSITSSAVATTKSAASTAVTATEHAASSVATKVKAGEAAIKAKAKKLLKKSPDATASTSAPVTQINVTAKKDSTK